VVIVALKLFPLLAKPLHMLLQFGVWLVSRSPSALTKPAHLILAEGRIKVECRDSENIDRSTPSLGLMIEERLR
jgi:hypothetical protein